MIIVAGLGFVGLTTALGFAEKGHKVIGVDTDRTRLESLEARSVPFHEPGLEEALGRHLGGNFELRDSFEDVVQGNTLVFVCVGTPAMEDGSADLSYVEAVMGDVLNANDIAQGYVSFVVKSTVPPTSTSTRIADFLESRKLVIGKQLGLAVNPEFLREGNAWEDVIHPDRIVIGSIDQQTEDHLLSIYEDFGVDVHRVSPNTAEFIKYSSNCYLAATVSFSNELSILAHQLGDVDISRCFDILHQDKRWTGEPAGMASYLFPGCGYGGYCLPKDTEALVAQAGKNGVEMPLLGSVVETNSRIKRHFVQRISKQLTPSSQIGILGLSFKPGSDDVRETPAADIVSGLIEQGFSNLTLYDPMANDNFKAAYPFDVDYATSLEEVVSRCSDLILITSWPEFRDKSDLVKTKNLIDLRYFL